MADSTVAFPERQQRITTQSGHSTIRNGLWSGSRRQCHSLLFVSLSFQCQPPCQPDDKQPVSRPTRSADCRLCVVGRTLPSGGRLMVRVGFLVGEDSGDDETDGGDFDGSGDLCEDDDPDDDGGGG